jgi:hypothetical protein
MPSYINRAVTAKGTILSGFKHHLRRSPCGFCLQDFVANMLIDLPDSTLTVISYILMVDCPWCPPRTAPRWFFYAYCWWLWALLTQFLPNVVSSVRSTDETNNILLFADKTTNKNCRMVGDQRAIDPPHAVNGKTTSAVRGVPPNSHVTNSEGWHHVSAADTGVLSTTFCDRLLPVRCTSHCRSAVINILLMLRLVSVSDTLQHSLIGWLFLVWGIFLSTGERHRKH